MVRDAFVPPEDCQSCGRCCFSDNPAHVRVFGCDWDRMDEHAQSFTVFEGNRCFMALVDGHCAALRADPETGRFGCGIYERRPDVCRSLERGTGACRGEYELKAGRPDVWLDRLRRAPRS
jgi:Fe-S-cluster containining protein